MSMLMLGASAIFAVVAYRPSKIRQLGVELVPYDAVIVGGATTASSPRSTSPAAG